MMDKLKMQTPNLVDKNVEQIAKLFPNVITEITDENGQLKKGIDFDLLKQTLSNVLVEDENERYRLDWPGKKASLLKANTPITKTLRPVVEESINFEDTENLFIEGDNFEVLKILQESYLGKIKMIYIDPPYNTGNDFLYKDDFKLTKEEYEDEIGIVNEEGGKLVKNTDANGRFHSDWLSLMYERLTISRDLLSNDGAIFISVDDNELHNLRKICDEIFGEENFVGNISRLMKSGGGKGQYFSPNIDYILVFSKEKSKLNRFRGEISEESLKNYYNKIETKGEKQGRIYGEERIYVAGLDIRPNQRYWIKCPNGSFAIPPGSVYPDEVIEGKKVKPNKGDGCWKWTYETYLTQKLLGNIVFKETKTSALINEFGKQSIYNLYNKVWLDERNGSVPGNFISNCENRLSSSELKKIAIPFDFAKPISLIKKIVNFIISKYDNAIIFDFFSGSATTAHAVMELNAEDDGNRKFIVAQLPEKTDEISEAYKAGYKTIAEIGKERIRRAGKKIKEEFLAKYEDELHKLNSSNQLKLDDTIEEKKKDLKEKIEHIKYLDIGFRVYKTDTSNMKEVFYHTTQLKQEQLSLLESNIVEGRTAEDLLTQVILDLGLELSLKIEKKEILDNIVFIVQHNSLVACFDDNINFKIIDEIAEIKPLKVVFKDTSFKDDKDRINVEERFKRLSPETVINVI